MYIDEHLRRLIEAISLVKPNYEHYETINIKNEKIIKRAERVYAYELYHQYRSLMKRDNIDDCYLNGEIYKSSTILNNLDNSGYYPDLVLHKRYDSIESETQYFICEIKMKGNPYLIDDLDKLTKLSKKGFGFNYYIFLCVGISMLELSRQIQSSENNYNGEIVCICVNQSKPEMFLLKYLTNYPDNNQ